MICLITQSYLRSVAQEKVIYQISLDPTHYCNGDAPPIFEDKDGDGEITQTTDPQTNEVIDRYHYYAFGLRWEVSDPYELEYIDENHYRYNSKEWDRISEWYDYGWRWYDPVIGRWNAVDPLADHPNQLNMSPFGYAWNNPIYWTDPDGLCPTCPEDATYGSTHYWGGAEFTFGGENWSTTMDELVVAGYDMDNASFFMEGIVFYMDGGRGQETKQGYGEYGDAGPIITAAGATGAVGKAHPLMRLGSIFSKFGNIITGWIVGHALSKKSGNNYMVDLTIKPGENKDPFNFTNAPAYLQVSMETIRMGMNRYMDSPEYRMRSGSLGVDTSFQVFGDTILLIADERVIGPSNRKNRSIKPLSPLLKN